MANREKGEFDLTLGGKTLTFKVGTAALIAFQELFGTPKTPPPPLPVLMAGVAANRLLYVRGFLWAGLREYHPEITVEGVNDLIDSSSAEEIQVLLGNLGMSTVADPADLKELHAGNNGNPPGAQVPQKVRKTGTGARSTSTRAALA